MKHNLLLEVIKLLVKFPLCCVGRCERCEDVRRGQPRHIDTAQYMTDGAQAQLHITQHTFSSYLASFPKKLFPLRLLLKLLALVALLGMIVENITGSS